MKGKNEQVMAYSITKKVQENLSLKENAPSTKWTFCCAKLSAAENICKTPFLFSEGFFHNTSLP